MRDLRDRLSQILKSSSVGIWEWNVTTNQLSWDEGTMQIYGVKSSQFKGSSEGWQKRLHPDDLERMTVAEYKKLFENGYTPTEFRIVRDDGEIRHI